MIGTLRSEWIKLHTVRVHVVLVVIAVAFPLVVIGLVTALVTSPRELDETALVELVVTTSLVSLLLLGTMVAAALTGEYTHGTIRPTYAATPSRGRVLLAKWLVGSFVVGVLTAAVLAAGWGLGAAVLSNRIDAVTELAWDDGTLPSLLSSVTLAVVLAWFALGIGLLVRNAPTTITLFLVWPLVVESLLTAVLVLVGVEGAGRWMPYQAALSAVPPEPDLEGWGRLGALGYFGAVALALVLIGALIERRRDA